MRSGGRRWPVGILVAASLGLGPVAQVATAAQEDAEVPVPELSLPEVVAEAPAVPGPTEIIEEFDPLAAPVTTDVTELPVPVEEMVGERGPASEVWLNEDGTRSITYHDEPIHYRVGGGWDPIDSRLVPDPERDGWVRNAANSWVVRFGPIEPDGVGGVEVVTAVGVVHVVPDLELTAAAPETTTSTTVASPASPGDLGPDQASAPTAEGGRVIPVVGQGELANTVTYVDVWPGVDLRYTVSGGQLKEDIVVRSGERSSFPFLVEGLGLMTRGEASSQGLLPDDGPLELPDDDIVVTGAIADAVTMAPLEVFDHQGHVVDDRALPSTAVEPTPAGSQLLTVTVDHGWLAGAASPETPVVIDPTYTLTDPTYSIDVDLMSSYLTNGTWNSPTTQVRVGNPVLSGNPVWRSFATLDFSEIGSGIVLSASVDLDRAGGTSSAYPVQLWTPPAGVWGPVDFVVNKAGTLRATASSVTDTASFSVGSIIANDLASDDGIVTFGFAGQETAGINSYKLFDFEITVVVNDPPTEPVLVAPADEATVLDTATPTLVWDPATDPNGYGVAYVATVSTSPDGVSGQSASSPIQFGTSWTVPEGVLAEGGLYYWSVLAWDYVSATRSEPSSFVLNRNGGPGEGFSGVSIDGISGAVSLSVPGVSLPAVGGDIGVGLSYSSLGGEHGLVGEYRWDVDGDHAVDTGEVVMLSRTDAQIAFDWGTGSASPSLPADDLLVRWDGFVTLPSGSWQFGARSNDGVRVTVDSALRVDKWVQRTMPSTPDWATVSTTGGVRLPITVEYFEDTSSSAVELWVRDASNPSNAFIVPAEWLTPTAGLVPPGWSVDAYEMAAAYERVVVTDGTAVLYTSGGGSIRFRKTADGTYQRYGWRRGGDQPVVVVNSDGTSTVTGGGMVHVFRADGALDAFWFAIDEERSAAPTSTFDGTGRLTAVTDPVSGRSMELRYSGTDSCASPPAALDSGGFSAPAGMLCGVDHWDGTSTDLLYKNGLLAYVANPGDTYWGFDYDGSGRVIGIRDPVAIDAYLAGSRTDWTELDTEITYDGDRVEEITAPAPLDSADRPARTFTYAPAFDGDGALTSGTLEVERAGVTGTYRTITYDGEGKTTADTDPSGRVTTIAYDEDLDAPVSVVAPGGLRTTYFYDDFGRTTDVYGPATSSLFNGDGTGGAGVPHTQTAYDAASTYNGALDGVTATWWDDDDPNDEDSEALPVATTHLSGAVNHDWNASSPLPGVVPSNDFFGRLTATITFPATGNYYFSVVDEGRTRVYLDGERVLNAWDSGYSGADGTVVEAEAGETRQLRIDYRHNSGDASLNLRWKTPSNGTATTVPGAQVSPGYSLVTSTVDAAGTVTDYDYTDATAGLDLEHGVVVGQTVDPGGLALETRTSFEPIGTGYLRSTGRVLPAGASTATAKTYYGDGEDRDNPCTTNSDPVDQGGQLELDTAADPDGAGGDDPIVREYVYDAAGRNVAYRIGSDDWTCITYDDRGRPLEVEYPAYGGAAGRTVTYDHAVDPDGGGLLGPDPLITAVTDPAGTITSTIDAVGHMVAYVDVWGNTTTFDYDQAGRPLSTTTPAGVLSREFDAGDQLTELAFGATVLANGFVYDSAGRSTTIEYPANDTNGWFYYDNLGLPSGVWWTTDTPSHLYADGVTRDAAGRVIDQTIDLFTDPRPSNPNFAYDAAGRLVDAWVPGRHLSWGFGTNTCGVATSGRNTNRTSQTIAAGATTGYCYDWADRLTSSTDSAVGTIDYDGHGNTTEIFGETHTYDAADRHLETDDGTTTVGYQRDATDRIVTRSVDATVIARYGYTGDSDLPAFTTNSSGTITELTIALPGGVLWTDRAGADEVWSYPNLHGDITFTTDEAGTKNGGNTTYDPYGNLVSGGVPDNSVGNLDNGWLGQHQRPAEHEPGIQPVIEMGARQYSSLLGRFLEVDPIEGGSCNDYDYSCADPVNQVDLTGEYCINIPLFGGRGTCGLNPTERLWCYGPTHLSLCNRAYRNHAIQAIGIACATFSSGGTQCPDTGRVNAMRHCLWSARMTYDFGRRTAQGFLDRHEASSYGPDYRADLRNNALGVAIGQAAQHIRSPYDYINRACRFMIDVGAANLTGGSV